MNNPFAYIPDNACAEAFEFLVERIELLKKSADEGAKCAVREFERGKMLGVLIAEDNDGRRHTLYAFSGQLGKMGFNFPGFVGPVFDYLAPDGYFKKKESEITELNNEIASFEKSSYAKIREEYISARNNAEFQLAEYKAELKKSKQKRDWQRKNTTDATILAGLIRQSQREKSELRRLKKHLKEKMQPFEEMLKKAEGMLEEQKMRRRNESEGLQQWLFDNFKLRNARGEMRSLKEIFSSTTICIPPSGSGECCAPKLLNAAYEGGLRPLAIAEYWYGKSSDGEVRTHGNFYPACRGKCLPVLTWMLQGLDVNPPLDTVLETKCESLPKVVYENEWFCVVDKPAGMLSVPGKSSAVSVLEFLEAKYGEKSHVKMAHRLDRDTSGLLIATFGEDAYRLMQSLFALRKVRKTYVAELEGDYRKLDLEEKGEVSLPLLPDWLDRPRQRVDFEKGKEAITEYEIVSVTESRSRVLFHPLTGRTHQLRVHSASEYGLNMPIVGDVLYGKRNGRNSDRMLLHAHRIEFEFPMDGKNYNFESEVPF